MKFIWTTDPHLDRAADDPSRRWLDELRRIPCDAMLLTGDIAEAIDVDRRLLEIAAAFDRPTYFVLGNHDYYRDSIARTRRRVIEACREDSRLVYLTDQGMIDLGDDAYLVGDDGWGDATVGDYENSPVRLNDFRLIEDFRRLPPDQWKRRLRELGEESAARLDRRLTDLPATATDVLVITHVPPFREACWYEGKTTDDGWAPFFVCGAIGDCLRRVAEVRRGVQLTVLCGHTHHDGVASILPNLTVHTGASIDGHPSVEAALNVSGDGVKVDRRAGK